LTDQRISTKLQLKALLKLMDLQYNIQYKKGTPNAAADALSRYEWGPELNAISECLPSWMQKLQEGYGDDPTAQQLLTKLAVSPDNQEGFSLQDGIIRYKEEFGWVIICLLNNTF
jgi:hypothetical protein